MTFRGSCSNDDYSTKQQSRARLHGGHRNAASYGRAEQPAAGVLIPQESPWFDMDFAVCALGLLLLEGPSAFPTASPSGKTSSRSAASA